MRANPAFIKREFQTPMSPAKTMHTQKPMWPLSVSSRTIERGKPLIVRAVKRDPKMIKFFI